MPAGAVVEIEVSLLITYVAGVLVKGDGRDAGEMATGQRHGGARRAGGRREACQGGQHGEGGTGPPGRRTQ